MEVRGDIGRESVIRREWIVEMENRDGRDIQCWRCIDVDVDISSLVSTSVVWSVGIGVTQD